MVMHVIITVDIDSGEIFALGAYNEWSYWLIQLQTTRYRDTYINFYTMSGTIYYAVRRQKQIGWFTKMMKINIF